MLLIITSNGDRYVYYWDAITQNMPIKSIKDEDGTHWIIYGLQNIHGGFYMKTENKTIIRHHFKGKIYGLQKIIRNAKLKNTYN